MANKKLIVGNWKMNVDNYEQAKVLATKCRAVAAKLAKTEIVVCPPFPFITAATTTSKIDAYHMGAQSASIFEGGSHTGSVGAKMLSDLGVEYVIAGHSEERTAGDTNETVSKRIARILEAGLSAIVCVGEKTRDEGGSHLDFLKVQIKETFANIPIDKAKKIVMAYEPVWAIGAKDAMVPEQVYEMSLFVKKVFSDVFGPDAGLKVKVLYGGAVNSRNARDIMTIGKVDGLLVGRESVNMPGFTELLDAVDEI